MKSMITVPSCLIIMLLSLAHSANGQEANPKTILGFLKPGDHVGITSTTSNSITPVRLNKYSEVRFAITRDERHMDLSQLASKYASVASQIEVARTNFATSEERELKTQPIQEGEINERVEVSLGLSRSTYLGRVVSVGDDYVLIEGNEPRPFKKALSASSIGEINWIPDELPLNCEYVARGPALGNGAGRTKR